MDVDKLQTTPLCKSSKKIRKPDAKIPICATPINESDTVSHFQPLISSDLMFGRYVLLKHIADGTFGRVYDAVDKYTGRLYALKIVKATKNCVENAKHEARKLTEIHSKRPFEGKSLIVQLIDHFDWNSHYCLVLEKLNLNLFQFLKNRNYLGYPVEIFKPVLKQLLQGVNLLHSMDLVHTDIKPENVLFLKDPCQQHADYFIKLIDFGNISYVSEGNRNTITTRQYRAPEVILGCCEWGKPCDVWSVACVAMEIYLGQLLFNTHDSFEHLGLIEKMIGNFPIWMVNRTRPEMKKLFYYKEVKIGAFDKLCINKQKLKKTMQKKIKERITLKEIFDIKNDVDLYDLMKRMLNVDPLKRLSCEEALKHKYFN